MKKVLFMLMALSLTFASCSSDTTSTEADNKKTTSAIDVKLKKIREGALSDITQIHKVYFDSEKGAVLYTKSKSNIVIPPKSIVAHDGKEITGDIVIKYIEIFEKGKMAVTNKPTMGIVAGELTLLRTGGEFYLDITYQGEQVKVVNPIKINISTSNSKASPVGMVLWNGDINANDNLTWLPADTKDLSFENDGAIFGGKGGTFYDVLLNNSSSFGWCNIDIRSNMPGDKVKIEVVPPAGFNHTNSSVYLAVKGEENMLAQFDIFNSGTNTFEEHTGLLPVGLECHIIFVAQQNGNFIYSIISTTIGYNANYTVSSNSLISTNSYSDLETAIRQLP